MTELKVGVRKQPAEYEPGEEIVGAAQWQLDRSPESVEARLLWHTTGRGFVDVGVVATVRFDAPLQDDTRPFRFTAPEAPYSYCGKLIRLDWAIELVALPHKESARVDLVIAPEAKPLEFSPLAN